MKKYDIETAQNGGAIVFQRHVSGTDGCTTSYGDKWVFDSVAAAGVWVDVQLGRLSQEVANIIELELQR